jgi:hypothetical protein
LDDILSAVDATTGRFIFEQGLTGELGIGRTRVLVTHHIALCKSRTKYLVELGDGTVEHAGFLSELEEDGTLTKIITHEGDEGATAVNSEVSSDHGETFDQTNMKTVVKKFVEEEKREKGAIAKGIYLKYINASGGFPFWLVAMLLFISQQAVTVGTFEKTSKVFSDPFLTLLSLYRSLTLSRPFMVAQALDWLL